jgi:hypothetical protein
MWSLSRTDFQYLFIGDDKYRRAKLTPLLDNSLSAEELEAFLSRSDLVTILRMFWMVRLAYDRLSVKNEDDLEFATHNDNIFHEGGFKDKDRGLVRSFDDKDAILKCIYKYRSLLFAPGRHTTEPVHPPSTEPADSLEPSRQKGSDSKGVSTVPPVSVVLPGVASTSKKVPESRGEGLSNEQISLIEIGEQHGFEEAIAAVLARETAGNEVAGKLEKDLIDVLAVEDEDQLIERLKHDVSVMEALNMDRILNKDSGHPPLNSDPAEDENRVHDDGGAGDLENVGTSRDGGDDHAEMGDHNAEAGDGVNHDAEAGDGVNHNAEAGDGVNHDAEAGDGVNHDAEAGDGVNHDAEAGDVGDHNAEVGGNAGDGHGAKDGGDVGGGHGAKDGGRAEGDHDAEEGVPKEGENPGPGKAGDGRNSGSVKSTPGKGKAGALDEFISELLQIVLINFAHRLLVLDHHHHPTIFYPFSLSPLSFKNLP